MNQDPLAAERRMANRLERLGREPQCGCCPERDPRCLELHHVAGGGRDLATVVICANCHRKVSDEQKDRPGSGPNADATLDTIGHFLLGVAELLRLVVAKLMEFGETLIALAAERADAHP